MIKQVPEGKAQTFERSISDPGEERFFKVWQNWDYRPGRLTWVNGQLGELSPRFGTRDTRRRALSAIPLPEVNFKGPSKQVVDFYSTGSQAFFISDKLFKLIESLDPGSLEHLEFKVRAKDGEMPFHAVMPIRVLEAIDPRRTTVRIEDEDLAGWYLRHTRFPEGIVFDNDVLRDVTTFSDMDAPGWYWSKELIEEAKSIGIRGLYADSQSRLTSREVARL